MLHIDRESRTTFLTIYFKWKYDYVTNIYLGHTIVAIRINVLLIQQIKYADKVLWLALLIQISPQCLIIPSAIYITFQID